MPPKPSAKGAKKAAKSQKVSRTGDKKKKHRRKETSAPRYWSFVESDVHYELVRERRVRANRC
ncbi:hypothetical protein DICVIV_10724 [Dictyocaulus viviparus]|uniref:Uncharacterized protein n=1 Tax=Dictyocaulus viviparus TaxID=29172 RepID=A0A0D8XHR2_DICVI|nr:hypothetical protein DICVIV_10724 [Dictyocaulus viviparus]